MEVANTIVVPGGLPGSPVLLFIEILVFSAPDVGHGSDIHLFSEQALIFSLKKLLTILSESFNRLLLPCCDINPYQRERSSQLLNLSSCKEQINLNLIIPPSVEKLVLLAIVVSSH